MSRLLPLLLVLHACSRWGFAPPDAAALDGAALDAPADAAPLDAPADAAPLDAPADAAPLDAPADAAPLDAPADAAPLDGAGADQGAVRPAGLLQNAGTGPVFRLLFGMAGIFYPRLSDAAILELEFNANTNVVVQRDYFVVGPVPFKAMDLDGQGRLLVAYYLDAPFTLDLVEISPALGLVGTLALSHTADPARTLEHIHALCYLPGGNFLVGAGSNADNNHFNEYDPAGNLIRGVHTSTLAPEGAGSTLSHCISRSDLEVFAHETSLSASHGRLLRFTRPAADASWTLTDSVAVADIEAQQGAGSTLTWSMALDVRNDLLYLAPYNPDASSIQQLIRCPAQGFSAVSCVPVGDPLPGAPVLRGSIIKLLAQIPGTDDLLAVNHGDEVIPESRRIYRYDAQTGAWIALFDLRQISGEYYEPQWYPALF